jgi:hypothetical protein
MKHIRPYNESAAELWHKISYGDLFGHMKGQLVEDFTAKEVQVVLGVASTLTWSKVTEYKDRKLREANPVAFARVDFSIDMRQNMSSLSKLRTYNYKGGKLDLPDIIHPRTKSNFMVLQFFVHRSSAPGKMLVFKTNDDYFYVSVSIEVYNRIHQGYYVCDGIAALVDLIKTLGVNNPR